MLVILLTVPEETVFRLSGWKRDHHFQRRVAPPADRHDPPPPSVPPQRPLHARAGAAAVGAAVARVHARAISTNVTRRADHAGARVLDALAGGADLIGGAGHAAIPCR